MKKSEIQLRAKRLLGAFAIEARKKSLITGQRKLIRAQYEKGLLLVKEDFVRLSDICAPIVDNKMISPQKRNAQNRLAAILFRSHSNENEDSTSDLIESMGKEKLRQAMYEMVQMYILQFQLIDNLLGILKREICSKRSKEFESCSIESMHVQ